MFGVHRNMLDFFIFALADAHNTTNPCLFIKIMFAPGNKHVRGGKKQREPRPCQGKNSRRPCHVREWQQVSLAACRLVALELLPFISVPLTLIWSCKLPSYNMSAGRGRAPHRPPPRQIFGILVEIQFRQITNLSSAGVELPFCPPAHPPICPSAQLPNCPTAQLPSHLPAFGTRLISFVLDKFYDRPAIKLYLESCHIGFCYLSATAPKL